MNFKQLLDLTYNMIDEVDEDEQIEIIVKGAINEAYRDLAKIDKRISTAYVPVIMGAITLPDNCLQVVSTSPELTNEDKIVGNSIITNKSGIVKMVYATSPEELIENEDEPDLNIFLHEALCLYACYKYMLHRKKVEESEYFLNRYIMKINNYEQAQAEMINCVNDSVVIDY